MTFDFELCQEGHNRCMVRRRSHDDYNGCGVFSVSEEFGAEICKRWNGYAAMTAAKDKAVEALKRLNETAISDMMTEMDDLITELEEVK